MKEEEIEKLVDYFTEKLYSHQYFIGRKEAKEDLGLKTVVDANDILSKAMTDLYEEYNKELNFGKMWNPENELGANAMQNKKAIIKSLILKVGNFQIITIFPLSIENSR